MFNFANTYQLRSKSFPGVTVTLRRIGPAKRAEIELSVSAARIRQREIATRCEQIRLQLTDLLGSAARDEAGAIKESAISPDCISLAVELQTLAAEAQALARSVVEPAFVCAAVKSIDGIAYEDQPATAELLCVHGPDALFDEIADAIGKNTYLTAEMAENFALPTTSGARGDGQATSTTAATASDGAVTPSAAAASTSPAV